MEARQIPQGCKFGVRQGEGDVPVAYFRLGKDVQSLKNGDACTIFQRRRQR